LMKFFFRHSVFSAAFEAADNQIIQWCMAIATCWPFLKFLIGYTIFLAAVQTADYYIIRHIFTYFLKKR
jgi:hypothetical protein